MKKYGRIVLVFLVLLAVCCEDFSDFFLEEYSDKESRGIEAIRYEVTTEEIYSYLTPVFSVGTINPSIMCSSLFSSGRIPVPSYVFLEIHLHFWEDPLFMKSLFLSQVETMRKAKEEEKRKKEEEAAKIASASSEAAPLSSSSASQHSHDPSEANSCTIEIVDKATPLLIEDNSPTLSFRLDSISLESNEGSSLSYSLNGGPFREYSEPIAIKDDTSLTVKTKEQDQPSFFLSSKVTVKINEAP